MHSDHHGAIARFVYVGYRRKAGIAERCLRHVDSAVLLPHALLIGKWFVMGTCCGENYDPERGYAVCPILLWTDEATEFYMLQLVDIYRAKGGQEADT